MISKILYQKCEKCLNPVPTVSLKVMDMQFELCKDCLADWNSWAKYVSDKKKQKEN